MNTVGALVGFVGGLAGLSSFLMLLIQAHVRRRKERTTKPLWTMCTFSPERSYVMSSEEFWSSVNAAPKQD